jgi:hypothetical protein
MLIITLVKRLKLFLKLRILLFRVEILAIQKKSKI